MRLPRALTSLDDRLLGDRLRRRPATVDGERAPRPPRTGRGAAQALGVVYQVSRLVFLLLALAVGLGIVFVLAPTNPDNDVVQLVDRVARGAAGPFRDVFTVSDDAQREVVVNYGFAAAVYLVASVLVGRLPRPTGS